ncbi:DUF4397 domain-containing protein [Moheibacter lacus]|uniref:DUF4397 domain-containing protein n=1 Tax=Moheibacter lacus TaxID=2745851 RepID=A0A838ZLB9_9FLAO|nr:DUF4397 domain-containing protein [Moheibacter lacus]MBA5628316.1 DUF4397 domain-containing protein [Moheibacter lacus]
MKRAIQSIKMFGKLGVGILAGLSVTSCLNNDDSGDIPMEDSGYVLFSNISPGSTGLKLFDDGEQFNNVALNYNEFIPFTRMGIGNNVLTLQGNSSTTDLDTINLSVELNKLYSVFAVNSAENVELLAYLDSPVQASHPSKSVIRFIQLSHNCPTVKVAIEGMEGDLGTYNFRNASSFFEIDQVFNKNLYLINAESNDTIFSKAVTLNGNSTYSIFSQGDIESENENLDLDVQYFLY